MNTFEYQSNVFKNDVADKGTRTKAKILTTALRLFRRRGFDQTTMRQIATAAGLATGAAYHYFPSKEAIMMAYFEQVQVKHAEAAQAATRDLTELRARLIAGYRAAFDVIADDQTILHIILRNLGDRQSPLSVMGPATAHVRKQSRAIYRDLLRGGVAPELLPLATHAAWALHMGLTLYFFFDDSPGAQKTRQLSESAAHLAADLLQLVSSPLAKPFAAPVISKLQTMLAAAGIEPAEEDN